MSAERTPARRSLDRTSTFAAKHPQRSRRPLLRALAAAAAWGATTVAAPHDARACGYSGGTYWALESSPDLPLDGFVQGRLGVVRPSWAPSYLAVAYRLLAGASLAPDERASALRAWAFRGGVELEQVTATANNGSAGTPPRPLATSASANGCATGTPTSSAQRDPLLFEVEARTRRAHEHWQAAQRAAGIATPVDLRTSTSESYASIENCLPDAIETAATTLETRLRAAGSVTPALQSWLDAQQTVFRNCARPAGGPFVPPRLPEGTDAAQRADRAYQIASALFYAGDFAASETQFLAIARDAQSPWAPWGRYLAARAVARGAMLGRTNDDVTELRRARAMIRAIVEDPSQRATHAAARRYAVMLDGRLQPREAAHELAVRLAREPLGASFGDTLVDYAFVLDRNNAALAITEPDADRLSAFVSIMQSEPAAAFDRARRLYAQSPEPVWLVAALLRAPSLTDAAVTPLLRAAQAVPATHPAALTLQYVRANALLARGDRAGAYALAHTALQQLGADESPSSRTLLASIALRSARTFDEFARYAVGHEAGTWGGAGLATPVCRGAECEGSLSVYPDAATMLTHGAPTSVWLRLARAGSTAPRVRALLAANAAVRATLTENTALLREATALAATLNPALAARLTVLGSARDAPDRTLALADLLLHAYTLGPVLRPGEGGPVQELTFDSTVPGLSLWCAHGGTADAAISDDVAPFLSPAERTALMRERTVLRALPAGPTYVARQLAQHAERFRRDPRLPELLHRAVVATRFGCRDGEVTAASREAFRALHRLFPTSDWARNTRYFY